MLIESKKGLSFWQQLTTDKDTLKLFLLLIITLGFAFIEFLYGYLANSLSLISDSAHMLFDSSALGIGVYAQFMSQKPPDLFHSYGFERYKVLSGYINGVFLIFIAFYIFIESLERLFEPPVVMSQRIMFVSILGFIINIVGLLFFHEHAHIGEPHSHSHSHSHSNSKKNEYQMIQQNAHDHNNNNNNNLNNHKSLEDLEKNNKNDPEKQQKKEKKKYNENLSAVFLHILADTLGSVGVIASTFLIQFYNLYIADPITSAIISVLIFASVVPLMKSSSVILMQSYPNRYENKFKKLIKNISNEPGVKQCKEFHLWAYISNQLVFTISLIIQPGIDKQQLEKKIHSYIYKVKDITDATIEFEEDEAELKSYYENQQKNQIGIANEDLYEDI